ncbi:GHMP kinase [Mucilaginibacter sp.]|uniref:GHMP family kinase ATP-binding protein n=1 Tax=Mucilaginibacter sp. TaxID=1882438 RepID=UPI00283ECD9D|nr:GHMP kinase [Mucilaginibacter sp.]MDR3696331.1 GHMP kinase [Mucilaginibacter sp.]
MEIIRSKAPLRLGLAGGGTDVSPFCDLHGGCILNATIDLFSYCTLIPQSNGKIHLYALDREESFESDSIDYLRPDGNLDLHKGVYNRIIRDFNLKPLSFVLKTYADAPAGSGLGTSSTMVVAILQAFVEWLKLPLGEYDIARLAFEIEREDLGLAGGKQDQYSAAFGGFNFMEFFGEKNVIVNPLRIKERIIQELEWSTILYYTGISRSSAKIIEDQTKSLSSDNPLRLEAMHKIKQDAIKYKEALLKGDFKKLFEITKEAYEAKKNTSSSITNDYIDEIYNTALEEGCYSGKISGAGGGGVLMLFVDPMEKVAVEKKLLQFKGQLMKFHFTTQGAISWTINI